MKNFVWIIILSSLFLHTLNCVKLPNTKYRHKIGIHSPEFVKAITSGRLSRKIQKKFEFGRNLRFLEKPTDLTSKSKLVSEIKQVGKERLFNNFDSFSENQFRQLSTYSISTMNFEIIKSLKFEKFTKTPEITEGCLAIDENQNIRFFDKFSANIPNGFIKCSAARFTKSLETIGWSRLYIKTYEECNPIIQAWGAGFLEGLLTSKQIFEFYMNLQNIRRKTTTSAIRGYSYQESLFYTHIALSQIQTDGLLVGMNYQNVENPLQLKHIYLINADGQIPEFANLFKNKPDYHKFNIDRFSENEESNKFDIKRLYKRFNTTDPELIYMKMLQQGHCSLLFKVLRDDNGEIKDLLSAHSTWDDFSEMHRIFKNYDFDFGGNLAEDQLISGKVTFSSYPGVMISTDDFYMTSNNLLVTETSLDILNDKIFSNIASADNYIPDFMRITFANRLAKTPKDWIKYFSYFNSGTYNSQWFIVDMNNVKKSIGKNSMPSETIMLLEQIPGSVFFLDLTDDILNQGWWASYNIPYLDKTREMTGFTDMERRSGNLYSYDKNPRAKIFAARNKYVTSIPEMKKLMEYNPWNEYAHSYNSEDPDNPTWDNPGYAIGARFDLIRYPELRKNVGSIDTKITNVKMFQEGSCEAISGPTHQDQPVFEFSQTNRLMPYGLPNRWDFDWLTITPEFIKNSK